MKNMISILCLFALAAFQSCQTPAESADMTSAEIPARPEVRYYVVGDG